MQVAVVMAEEEMESTVVMSLLFCLFVPFERESAKGKRMKRKKKVCYGFDLCNCFLYFVLLNCVCVCVASR